MKVIYPDDYINSITANESDANYPASNVQDDHPQKIWKATSEDAKLALSVAANANAVAVFNTNATSVSVSVRESLGLDWGTEVDWQASTELDWVEQEEVTATYDLSSSDTGAMWAEYTAKTIQHVVEITFSADAGTVIQAGVVVAGIVKSFKDPKDGINERLIDYSIRKQLNNGAFWRKKLDVVRAFSGRFTDERDDVWTFLHSIAQLVGPDPLAWRIVTKNATDWEWVVYARFADSMPEAGHIGAPRSEVSFEIIEEV